MVLIIFLFLIYIYIYIFHIFFTFFLRMVQDRVREEQRLTLVHTSHSCNPSHTIQVCLSVCLSGWCRTWLGRSRYSPWYTPQALIAAIPLILFRSVCLSVRMVQDRVREEQILSLVHTSHSCNTSHTIQVCLSVCPSVYLSGWRRTGLGRSRDSLWYTPLIAAIPLILFRSVCLSVRLSVLVRILLKKKERRLFNIIQTRLTVKKGERDGNFGEENQDLPFYTSVQHWTICYSLLFVQPVRAGGS